MSPSGVSAISAFTFGPVGALTSLEFSESGWPPLNTDGPIRNPQNSLHVAGMLIPFESFLGILLLDTRFFFSTKLFDKFV